MTQPGPNPAQAIRRNIQLVADMEERYLSNRTFIDRVADGIAGFSGSMTFVAIHVLFFAFWILVNLKLLPPIPVFDPYPFMLLSMIVSLEAIFLSTFVLMKQNRMARRADSRAHLDLQINLLAEKEMTMVLQMLRVIGKRVGVRDRDLNRELDELSSETPVELLAEEIEQKLTGDD